MATGKSGYVEFTASSFGGKQTMRINWSETYNQSANTSDVTITSIQVKSNTYVGQPYYGNMVIKINGVTAITLTETNNRIFLNDFNSFATVNFNGTTITGSVTGIPHNADGSKTVAISIEKNSYGNPIFYAASPGNITFAASSQNIALTNIPRQYTLSISAGTGSSITVKRGSTTLSNGATITYGDVLTITFAASTGYSLGAHTVNGNTFTSGGTHTVSGAVSVASTASPIKSTISAPNGTFGSKLTITVTRYSTAYTHTITYSCAGATGTLVTKSTSTSIRTTPDMSTVNRIPNATSAPCTFTCITYDGNGVEIGTYSTTITLSVPDSVKPSPSLSVSDAMDYASTYGGYVQGQSKAKVTVTDGNQYSATTSSRSTSANGATYKAASFTTGALVSSGANTISTTVKDSRGRTGSASTSITVLAYTAPSISSFGVHRTDSTGTADDNGEYFVCSYSVAITALNSKNGKTLTMRYRPTGGSWTSINIPLSAYSQSGTTSPIAISTDNSYEVQLSLADDFSTITRATTLSTTPSVISFKAGGKGAAFGKAAEQDGLDVEWDATFRGVVDVVQRRNDYTTLSSPGWYRIISYHSTANNVNGGRAFILDLNILRSYNNTNNEVHSVRLFANYNNLKFTGEESLSNALGITKVRYNVAGEYGYIDIYYSLSTNNGVSIDYAVHTNGIDEQALFTIAKLEAVADAPSGETVKASHNFSANTNGDISSLITFNNATYSKAVRSGNIVNISFQGNSRTWAESEYLCTLPSSLAPSIVHWPVGYLNGSPVELRIDTVGIQIWIQPPTSTGRLYFDCTYIIA